jgi:hypothetical protein
MNSLKLPKEQSESVYRRRTDNTMAKRKRTKGQTTIYKTYIYNYKIDQREPHMVGMFHYILPKEVVLI